VKTYREIKDIIFNNPRADKKNVDVDDKAEKQIKDKMLYDDVIKRMKDAFKRRKRKKKIDKLQSRDDLWKGLENYDMK
jgi:hypothetical protein